METIEKTYKEKLKEKFTMGLSFGGQAFAKTVIDLMGKDITKETIKNLNKEDSNALLEKIYNFAFITVTAKSLQETIANIKTNPTKK